MNAQTTLATVRAHGPRLCTSWTTAGPSAGHLHRLSAYNHADLVTMRQMEDALAVRDATTYNALVARMNSRSGAQSALWSSLGKFQRAFDEAAP